MIEWIVDGIQKHEIIKRIRETHNVKDDAARNIYNEALAEITLNDAEKQHLKSINMLRLQNIYQRTMVEKKYSSAIRAVDIMNKTAGLYDNEIKEPEESEYNIKFG